MAKQKKQDETQQKPNPMVFLDEPINEISEEEVEEMINEPDEFDIFADIGDKMTQGGDSIKYSIKKDGQFIAGAIKHPFTFKGEKGWDAVRAKFGGGTYQVTARSTNRNGYVKSEARNVADPEYVEEENDSKEKNSPLELLSFMESQRKAEKEEQRDREERLERERKEEKQRLEAEAKERMEEARNSSNQTMTMMMAMMKSQSEQTTALLTAMMAGKKEEPIKVEKIVEMMDARMEKMLDRLTSTKEKDRSKDISTMELIKMQADAEDRGYRKAKEIQELADEKAEEIADMRESGNREEKPSEVMKLVETLAPAIQSFMVGRMGMPDAAQTLPAPQAAHTVAKPLPVPQKRAVMPVMASRGPIVIKKEHETMDTKELIARTVIQDIGADLSANMLTQKFNPEGTADKSLAVLSKFGVTPESLCSQYSVEDMMRIAKAKGIPDAIRPYIERYHAHIKAKTTVGAGIATTDKEQQNS